MDPVAFFPLEIAEKIFDNLNGNDLIEASAVSPSWYHFVANRKDFKKKVKVKFLCNYNRGDYADIINALMCTAKSFENLEMHCCWRCLPRIMPFVRQHKWKTVIIKTSSYTSKDQAIEFFKCVQNDLEYLDISEIYVKSNHQSGPCSDLQFPKLKVFNSSNIQSFLYNELFHYISTLTEFRVHSNIFGQFALSTMDRLVRYNVNLKVLECSGSIAYKIFMNPVEKFRLYNLTDVILSNSLYETEPTQDFVFGNVLKLLWLQKNLQSVTISDWMEEDFILDLIELPIKKLTIKTDIPQATEDDWTLNTLKVNPCLVSLSIRTYRPEPAMKIIKKLPNLSHLECNYADEKFLNFLQQNAKNLKSLSIELLNITDFSKFHILKNVKLSVPYYISSMKGLPEHMRKE